MKKVYITRKLPNEIVNKLSEHFDVDMWQEEDIAVPQKVLKTKVREAEGLLCLLTDTVNRELLEQAPNLKVISNLAAGYNNIDVDAAVQKGVVVTNTPGVLTDTTADLTFALLMATARRIPEASQFLRNGEWGAWSPMQMTGQDITGSTLGIIGMGRIAEAVVQRAKGFDMRVIYHNRSRKPEVEERFGIEYAEFDELISSADFVAILIPYNPALHHLIGREELANMKKEAILINTGRGGLVDEEALYEALVKEEIWAAGLDVFEKEPMPLDHPLLTLPNVVVLPHIGSASVKTRLKMGHIAAENIIEVLQGNSPLTPVTQLT